MCIRDRPWTFCRCHSSFVVNFRHAVQSGPDYILLDDGQRIPVSRAFRKNVENFIECLTKTPLFRPQKWGKCFFHIKKSWKVCTNLVLYIARAILHVSNSHAFGLAAGAGIWTITDVFQQHSGMREAEVLKTRRKNYVSYLNETVTRSRRTFRTPDKKMEP